VIPNLQGDTVPIDPSTFVGRQESHSDIADPVRAAGLAALLDHETPPWAPGMLPPLGHWLCFPPQARQSLLGQDGHPRRDDKGLLPAIDLPRRMWAGSRIQFLAPVPLGSRMERVSTLTAATPKEGRSGRMLFATVRHEIAVDGQIAIIDEHDIVYREAVVPGSTTDRLRAEPAAPLAETRSLVPDPVMLFRYSALTFNGHRIHYDRDYTHDIEGYPGLVVHGPLIATMLLDHLLGKRPGQTPTSYVFRASAPSFDGESITLGFTEENGSATLRADNGFGPAMSATATLATI
jgi:3-methylfumaryl-CoA hydratase